MSDSNASAPAADSTPAADSAPAAPQKRRGRPVDPNGSLAKARNLFNSLPEADRTRANVVEKFQSVVGLSKGTAAAYFSLINRGK